MGLSCSTTQTCHILSNFKALNWAEWRCRKAPKCNFCIWHMVSDKSYRTHLFVACHFTENTDLFGVWIWFGSFVDHVFLCCNSLRSVKLIMRVKQQVCGFGWPVWHQQFTFCLLKQSFNFTNKQWSSWNQAQWAEKRKC